jgi:hypothetical protein
VAIAEKGHECARLWGPVFVAGVEHVAAATKVQGLRRRGMRGGVGARCNALNLGVDFFLLFSHQIQALLFPFPFSSR